VVKTIELVRGRVPERPQPLVDDIAA
jgi:hypothetical protein